jgi:hypothetical protein
LFTSKGFEYWKIIRKEWTKKPKGFNPKPRIQINHEKVLNELEIYPDCPEFNPRVPLSEMVDILQIFWKEEESDVPKL